MRSKVFTVKAATLAAALLLGAGTAAAATGSLPGAPHRNHHSGRHGEHSGGTTTSSGADESSSTTSTSTGHEPNPHSLFGLCNAAEHNEGHTQSTVFPTASQCESVVHPGRHKGLDHASTTTTTSGSDEVKPAQEHRKSAQEHGKPEHVPAGPPVTTPPNGTAHVPTPNRGEAANGHKP